MAFRHLFESIAIGGRRIGNRIGMTPMASRRGDADGPVLKEAIVRDACRRAHAPRRMIMQPKDIAC